MAHLGDFGKPPVEVEDVTFGYFDETLRANPTLGELDFVEFMSQATGVSLEDPAALTLVKTFAQTCLHPDDFDQFWALARKNRQGVEDIFEVLMSIVEAATDRPTGRPSDSSDGPLSTAPRSADGSFSRAMRQLEGRPDLQLAVMRAQEVRAG